MNPEIKRNTPTAEEKTRMVELHRLGRKWYVCVYVCVNPLLELACETADRLMSIVHPCMSRDEIAQLIPGRWVQLLSFAHAWIN